jgi:hypothetical protein
MLQGDIKAAYTVIGSLRMEMADQWDRRATEAQIEELAGKYDHPDVMWVCVTVARDPSNRSPVMLATLAPRILEKLHAKVASNPTRSTGNRRDDKYLCDTCSLTRNLCEQQAGNLDGADHTFKTIRDAEAEREKQRYVRNFPTDRDFRVGRLPADVTTPQHPEPQIQEEEAS